MRVYELQAFGMDHLRIATRQRPEPASHEVLVSIHAASLNYRDILMIAGEYYPSLKFPLIPFSDGSGEIVGIGSDVSRFKIADRVVLTASRAWSDGRPSRENLRATLGGPIDGTLAECICVAEDDLVALPDYLSYEEGASLPCAATTAWNSLCICGELKAGDWLLILGTGGVSIFALQFAQLLGARTIVISSSDEKLERARELGATACINRLQQEDWEKEVYAITERKGVNQVIEVGGAGTLERSLRSVCSGGQISLIGMLAGREKKMNLVPVFMNHIRMQGIFLGSKKALNDLILAMEAVEMHPVLDRIFPFQETPDAIAYLQSGFHFGKVAISMR